MAAADSGWTRVTRQFELKGVTYSYPGADRNALDRVDLSVGTGSLHALLGPNGSGKSTLLQVMLGEARASSGHVSFRARSIVEWKRREIATQVAFVPQSEPLAFPLRVRELVEMGRYPHIGTLGRAGPEDRRAVGRGDGGGRCRVVCCPAHHHHPFRW